MPFLKKYILGKTNCVSTLDVLTGIIYFEIAIILRHPIVYRQITLPS